MPDQTHADRSVGSVVNVQALSPDFRQHAAASHDRIAPWRLRPLVRMGACLEGCLQVPHIRQIASTREKHGHR
jgi:hypothetical protein